MDGAEAGGNAPSYQAFQSDRDVLVEKAREKQTELKKQGIEAEILREEPFTTARDSLGFKVYLMIWTKGRTDCTVKIEEM